MKHLNVHASLYIRVFTISMDHEQKKTHLLDDHKDLFAFFWSFPIYTIFHWTSLLLEAFNFLGSAALFSFPEETHPQPWKGSVENQYSLSPCLLFGGKVWGHSYRGNSPAVYS